MWHSFSLFIFCFQTVSMDEENIKHVKLLDVVDIVVWSLLGVAIFITVVGGAIVGYHYKRVSCII